MARADVFCVKGMKRIFIISFWSAPSLCVFSHISQLSMGSPFLSTILSRPFWLIGLTPLRVQLLLDIFHYLSFGVFGFFGITVFLKMGNLLSLLLF